MTKKNLQQHRNIVKVQGADALRSATDELKSQGYFPAPMPNDFGHRSNSSGSEFGLWEDYIHAKLTCQEPGTQSASQQYATLHLSSGVEQPTPDNIGTPGLGYMEWGIGNRNPNVVSLLREASPYTASAHRFNTDLCAGKGPRFVYAYVQYVGGNITEKRIAFKDAGVLIKGWIRDLKRELSTLEGGQNDGRNLEITRGPPSKHRAPAPTPTSPPTSASKSPPSNRNTTRGRRATSS